VHKKDWEEKGLRKNNKINREWAKNYPNQRKED
jgi:hypothetical protein